MPVRIIKAMEYECVHCGHKWLNWVNGKEGPRPKKCAKCRRKYWNGDKSRRERYESIEPDM